MVNAIFDKTGHCQVAAGKIGQSPAPVGTAFEMQVNAVGRLSDPKEFAQFVLTIASDAYYQATPTPTATATP